MYSFYRNRTVHFSLKTLSGVKDGLLFKISMENMSSPSRIIRFDLEVLPLRFCELEVLRFHFLVDPDPEPESHPKEPELESCGYGSKVDLDPHSDPEPSMDLDLP